jgi:hypothetical protein
MKCLCSDAWQDRCPGWLEGRFPCKDGAYAGAPPGRGGTLYASTGRQQQSRAALAIAIEMYRAMDMTLWLPQAEAELAQTLRNAGNRG